MPSGHDTLNLDTSIDDKISESLASVYTWDHKKIVKYEALGRATSKEFEEAVRIMDRFIGRKGVFLPRIIIVDEKGNHLETTNRTKLPTFEKSRKAELLGYELFDDEMPLTNPVDASDEIEAAFLRSGYAS
jgi:lysine 2,3-aminomutase